MAAVSLELEAYKRKAARPLGDCIINGDLEGVKSFFNTHTHFKADQLCWTEKFHADAVTPALIAVACNNLEIFKVHPQAPFSSSFFFFTDTPQDATFRFCLFCLSLICLLIFSFYYFNRYFTFQLFKD
jgi:hypothetical protein